MDKIIEFLESNKVTENYACFQFFTRNFLDNLTKKLNIIIYQKIDINQEKLFREVFIDVQHIIMILNPALTYDFEFFVGLKELIKNHWFNNDGLDSDNKIGTIKEMIGQKIKDDIIIRSMGINKEFLDKIKEDNK